MGIFTPDFANQEAGIPIYDKVRAVLQITAHKPVINTKVDPNTGATSVNACVQHNLELVGIRDASTGKLDTAKKGSTVSPYKVWVHNEGGMKFGKPFLMAAAGYTLKEEEKANKEFFLANDWNFAGDPGMSSDQITLGAAWSLADGKMVEVTLVKNVQPGRDGRDDFESQEFKSWAPVKDL